MRTSVAFGIIALALTACSDRPNGPLQPSSADDLPPSLQLPPSRVVGVIADAATGAPVVGPVRVRIVDSQGVPTRHVRAALGGPISTYTVPNGQLAVVVGDDAPLPLALTVTATAAGYAPGAARVVIRQPGDVTFRMHLVALAAPPEGAAVAELHAQGGPIELAAEGPTRASLAVPAGARFAAPNGELLGPDLHVALVSADALHPRALLAMPGGFEADVPDVGAGSFVTAGFAAVTIADLEGRPAARIEPPAQLQLAMPVGVPSARLGRAYQAGDAVPVWSFDVATGVWRAAGQATLAAAPDGRLVATVPVDRSGIWNLAELFREAEGEVCGLGQELTVAVLNNDMVRPLEVLLSFPGRAAVTTVIDNAFKLPSTPALAAFGALLASTGIDVEARMAGADPLAARVVPQAGPLCGQEHGVQLTSPPSPDAETALLTVRVFEVCANAPAGTRGRPIEGAAVLIDDGVLQHTNVNGNLVWETAPGHRVRVAAEDPRRESGELEIRELEVRPGTGNELDFMFHAVGCDPRDRTGARGRS